MAEDNHIPGTSSAIFDFGKVFAFSIETSKFR